MFKLFTIFNESEQRIPIKVWLEDPSQIEADCLGQALNLSRLPFAFQQIALMPDTHTGFGMPIGGVLATTGAVIPNAVGVDIGCGMCFAETGIYKGEISKIDLQNLVSQIMRDIPTGFQHHKKKQPCRSLDNFTQRLKDQHIYKTAELCEEIEKGYYQVGTLGGGNHFVELQEDDSGKICIMLHSGSRNFGYRIAKYFNELAKDLNTKWNSPVPSKYDLAYLPVDSAEGTGYLSWMELALEFAMENREKMMHVVMDDIRKLYPHITFENFVNAHHNYAAFEEHFGTQVVVHRKGAIRVRQGELGIVPGAMGSYSYIVRGLGNPDSFYSCSHGAGRKMSRKKAMETIPVEKTITDLKELGVILGKSKKGDVSEESRFAYKDIDFVINQELDLIQPIKRLKTLAVIKG
ncbi:protein RtcB [Desulforamulus profundi]|uniref:3'-phosphate/5'-hydroxy nucleic acid ligase n=1 Tax=Desulforamulus profundi TaxID=1383067 RepID=A0A2C6MCW7_9FIRM|nr:protein RtcB [Desulforamulus profundi]